MDRSIVEDKTAGHHRRDWTSTGRFGAMFTNVGRGIEEYAWYPA